MNSFFFFFVDVVLTFFLFFFDFFDAGRSFHSKFWTEKEGASTWSPLDLTERFVTRQTPVGNVASDRRNDRASTVAGTSPEMSAQEYTGQLPGCAIQYWPFGVRPNRCCPTMDDTASQVRVMCRTIARESRHMRCSG